MLDAINRRLSIGLRLAMVGVLVVVSFGICSGIFLKNGWDSLEFSKKELRGVAYSDAAWVFLTTGDSGFLKHHALYDPEFSTVKSFRKISVQENDVARDMATAQLIWDIGGGSNMSQDPDQAGYYLSEIQIKRMPILWAQAVGMADAVAMPASDARNAAYAKTKARVDDMLARIQESYNSVFSTDTTGELKPQLVKYQTQIAVAGAALKKAGDAAVYQHQPGFSRAYMEYQKALAAAWPANHAAFAGLLHERINASWDKTLLQLTIILVFVLIALALLVLVTYGLSKRFKGLDHAMTRLNQGDKTVDVPYLSDTNETGRIAQTLAHMKASLIQKEKDSAQRRADREAAEAAQRAAEEEAQRRSEELVVSTFGEGLLALASDDLDFRLEADVPVAYRGLKENFNTAIAKFEQNRRDRDAAAKQREADRLHAEEARKEAEERARQKSVALVVSSFGAGLRALAERDLTFSLNMQLPEEYAGLQSDFNSAMRQLCDAMRDIDGRASDISSNCMEISKSSKDMAQRTERQAAALEQTSAAVTELTSTVAKSAESAVEASGKAGGAKTEAEHGNAIVLDAISAMRGIAKSSGEMSQIISAIDEIAFQTNLLALNAGVEAARAGEAGRGFAVVASEVRALAGRSAEAAHQIKSLIKSSEDQVAGGVKLVEESGAALARIVENISTITSLMSELASSQREQATALSEIDSAISDMDRVTQQNAAMAEESNAASENLAGHATNMAGLVAQFKVKA